MEMGWKERVNLRLYGLKRRPRDWEEFSGSEERIKELIESNSYPDVFKSEERHD